VLPNFLIIGSARCGTTWMWRNLRLHPQIHLPAQLKELNYFTSRYNLGRSWYEAQFGTPTEPAVGEASPDYLFYPDAPGRIRELLPDARLIVSLRNPVDRAYSHYWNLVANAQPGEVNRDISFEDKLEMTPRLITEGLYAEKLERYFALFPREQLLVLRYDELRNDARFFLRRIYEFLGVDPDYQSPLTENRVNSTQLKLGRSRLLFYLYKGLSRLGGYGLSRRVEGATAKELPKMQAATRRRLLDEYYLDEFDRLESMLDWDLEAWRTVPQEKADRAGSTR